MTPTREIFHKKLDAVVRAAFRDGSERAITDLISRLAASFERIHLDGVDAAEDWRPIAEFETHEAIRRARR